MSHPQPDGYLARPPSGAGSPVLVLHAWWGLNDDVKNLCDRLAAEGFLAFAPDLYNGIVTDEISVADELAGPIFENLDTIRIKLDRAVTHLAGLSGPGDRPIAAIGFSLGAFMALDLSISHPHLVQTVVTFYGTHPGDYGNATASYLGHFAEIDDFEPPSEVDALEEKLREAGRPVTIHRYPGTGHWFFEPGRKDVFDEEASTLAWQRTIAFLKQHAA